MYKITYNRFFLFSIEQWDYRDFYLAYLHFLIFYQ